MNEEQALARLQEIAGKRKTIDIAALPADLCFVKAEDASLLGRGAFNYAGANTTLTPDTPVVVCQGRVRLATVAGYIDQLAAHGELPEAMVSDRAGDGRLWHLDGLHRMIAARLMGQPIGAGIWR